MVALLEPSYVSSPGPEASEPVADRVLPYFRRADEAYQSGDYRAAVREYDAALAIRPLEPNALNNRGIAHARLGAFEKALADFELALTRTPDDPVVLSNYAVALLRLERFGEALDNLNRVIDLRPSDLVIPLMNKGVALLNLGRDEEALEAFEATERLEPRFFEALHNQAATLVRLGRFRDALAMFDKSLRLRPDAVAEKQARKDTLDLLLRSLAENGFMAWSGGKPKGSKHPAKLAPGPPISDYIIEERERLRG